MWWSAIWFSKWLISIKLECLRSILILFSLSFSGMYLINRALQRLRSRSSNTSAESRKLILNPIQCGGSLHTYFPVMQSQGQVVIASWEKAKWWCFCWLQRLLSGRGAPQLCGAMAASAASWFDYAEEPCYFEKTRAGFLLLRFRLPFTLNLLHHFSFSKLNFYIVIDRCKIRVKRTKTRLHKLLCIRPTLHWPTNWKLALDWTGTCQAKFLKMSIFKKTLFVLTHTL